MGALVFIPEEIVNVECKKLGITPRQLRRMRESGLIIAKSRGLGRGLGRTMEYEVSTICRLSRILELRKKKRNDKWILYWLWRDGENVDTEKIRQFLLSISVLPVSLLERLDTGNSIVSTLSSLATGKYGVFYLYSQTKDDSVEIEEQYSIDTINLLHASLSIEGLQPESIVNDLIQADDVKLFASNTFKKILTQVDSDYFIKVNQIMQPQLMFELFSKELVPRLSRLPMMPKRVIDSIEKISDPLLLSFFIVYVYFRVYGKLSIPSDSIMLA